MVGPIIIVIIGGPQSLLYLYSCSNMLGGGRGYVSTNYYRGPTYTALTLLV